MLNDPERGVEWVLENLDTAIRLHGLKHPVEFLDCQDLQAAGLAAMSLGFIADAVAFVMFVVHALVLAGLSPIPAKLGKWLMLLVWTILSIGFLCVVILAPTIYTTEWRCDNPVIPKIRLDDHFDLNYGTGFAVIGFVSSCLCLLLIAFGIDASVAAEDELEAKPVSGVSKISAGANFLVATVCVIIVAFVTAVLADGRSVITLKTGTLPIATNPELADALGGGKTLDFLLRPTYGIGLHHDSAGRSWTQVDPDFGNLNKVIETYGVGWVVANLETAVTLDVVKHPVPFLECNDLEAAGLTAMSLGFIANVVTFLMFVIHCLAMAGLSPLPAKLGKIFMVLIWTVLSSGFLIVVILAATIFSSKWTCDNPVIPELVLSDSFDLHYGIVFAVLGFVSSVVCVIVILCGVSSQEPAKPDVTIAMVASTSTTAEAMDPSV